MVTLQELINVNSKVSVLSFTNYKQKVKKSKESKIYIGVCWVTYSRYVFEKPTLKASGHFSFSAHIK